MAHADTILFDIAADIRAAIESGFQTAGRELPERRFVSNGDVADDCDQLAVEVTSVFRMSEGQEVATSLKRSAGLGMDVAIRLSRCQPSGETIGDDYVAPSPEELQDAASDLLIDGWVMRQSLIAAYKAGDFESCNDLALGRLEAFGPLGGIGGWTLNVRVQVT